MRTICCSSWKFLLVDYFRCSNSTIDRRFVSCKSILNKPRAKRFLAVPIDDIMDARGGRKEKILPSGVPSSYVSLNIIQNGSFGFSRSIYLSTDHNIYLFNCPETNRRLFAEHGIRRIPLVRNVFFTHGSWENVGGLAGLAAFMRSVEMKKIQLHGPWGMAKITNVARTFGDNPRLSPCEKPYLDEYGLRDYEDSTVEIRKIPLTDSMETEERLRKYMEDNKDIDPRQSDSAIPFRADDISMVYVCKLKPKYGKIILDKCLERGIRIGPEIGKLQRGEVAKNAAGDDVHPDDVREPPLPPQYFVVFECPDERFLDSLQRQTEREELFAKFSSGDENLKLIVHFSPSRIVSSSKYQEWMKKFPVTTVHWICNDSTPTICHLEGAYKAQLRMNAVHSEIFPLLWHHGVDVKKAIMDEEPSTSSTPSPPDSSTIPVASPSPSPSSNILPAEPFTKFCFRPPIDFQSFHRDDILFMDEDPDDGDSKMTKSGTTELERFKRRAAEFESSGDRFPTITFLGTSAAAPTKYRNISSIWFDLGIGNALMMDCGESTLSQVRLLFGPDESDRKLVDLKAVFISHLHLDHHFGLFSLILERKLAFEKLGRTYEKLILFAATPLIRAHKEFSSIVENVTGLCEFFTTAQGNVLEESKRTISRRLGLRSIDVAKVVHPQCASGYVIVTGDGKKIVYSGDTAPCQELIDKGKNADLLIHEGTHNDGFEREAAIKKHSTKGQAIEVGRAMNSKWTILTHFTGANSKLPYMKEELIKANPNVGVACDFMRIRWDQLALIPQLVPVIFEMHACSIPEQELNSTKKRIEQMDGDFDGDEEETKKPSKTARRE